jgi:hypothetical protein
MNLTSTIKEAEHTLSLLPKNEEELKGLIREKIRGVISTPEYKGKKSKKFIEKVIEELYPKYEGIIAKRTEFEHAKIKLEVIRDLMEDYYLS